MFKIALIALLGSLSLSAMAYKAVPGEFIVKMRRGVSAKQAFSSSAIRNVAKKARKIKGTKGRFIQVKMKPSLVAQGFKAFNSNPAFEYIEPNFILSLPKYKVNGVVNRANVPADKMFDKLWGLHNKSHGHDVGALNAWKTTKGSKKVVVAIIDTGIDYNHPDLKNNMWVNAAEANGTKGVDDDGNGYVDDIYGYDFGNDDADPMDDNSHGTHCAGTIGAVHNEIGVAGVAANVRLMAVKFLTKSGGGTLAGAIESIHYAADNGAHILSNSWGGEMRSEPKSLKEAVEYSNSKGVLFIAAAGNARNDNDGRVKGYPASHKVDNVVSVAAFQSDGKKASFTSYGETSVHVAAPGVDILSTTPGGKYASYSGTSMATPHVAGVTALLLSLNAKEWVNRKGAVRNLDVNPKAVRDLLINTSKKHEALDNISVSDGYVKADQLIKAAVLRLRK